MSEKVDLWYLAGSVQTLMTNALRVMRGAGSWNQVIGDIESVAYLTEQTKGDFNLRSKAAAQISEQLKDWRYDENGYPKKNLAAWREIIDASLRIVTAEMSGNGTEWSKAWSDMQRALADWRRVEDEKREAEERAELEQLAKRQTPASGFVDMRARMNNDRRCEAANDNVSSFVYFITDGEAIKIGKANNPKSRLSGLQTSHHKPLRILGLLPGDERLEGMLHGRFRKYHIRGEWFHDSSAIRTFIRKHATNGEALPTDLVAA